MRLRTSVNTFIAAKVNRADSEQKFVAARRAERRERQMPSLQDRLDEIKKTFESGGPPYNVPREAIETMHRATAELSASRIADAALKIGDRAPNFTLFNQDHREVGSADLLREGPLVVGFFRGHW